MSTSSSERTPKDWGELYRDLRPIYEAFAKKLEDLLGDLLHAAEIQVVQMEARAKEVTSFVAKVEDKGDKYTDPMVDVTDLCGVRIITYYREDSEAVGDLLRREFEMDDDNFVAKGDDLAPNQFGYLSDHYVVRLDSPRAGLDEWRPYVGRAAEIQVRTATQHAWAAIEHRLGYKRRDQLPRSVQRRLYRLSALFELADEQFSAARMDAEQVREDYAQDLRGGNLDIPLDLSSLAAYVEESPRVAHALDLMRRAGLKARSDAKSSEPFRRDQDQSDLIETLARHGIDQLSELDDLLAGVDEVKQFCDRYGEASRAKHFGMVRFPEDLLNILVFALLDDVSSEEIQRVYGAPGYDPIWEALEL